MENLHSDVRVYRVNSFPLTSGPCNLGGTVSCLHRHVTKRAVNYLKRCVIKIQSSKRKKCSCLFESNNPYLEMSLDQSAVVSLASHFSCLSQRIPPEVYVSSFSELKFLSHHHHQALNYQDFEFEQ